MRTLPHRGKSFFKTHPSGYYPDLSCAICRFSTASAQEIFSPSRRISSLFIPDVLGSVTRMNSTLLNAALDSSAAAARAAGSLMRQHLRRTKKVNEATAHDLKLDLDVRCQRLITRALAADFPDLPVLGEEGYDEIEVQNADFRWVVDPIDGTVNFAHGIPHACVCIALQARMGAGPAQFETISGVVYDPFQDELWTALQGRPAKLNGRRIRVSRRQKLADSVVTMGFAKSQRTLDQMLPIFNDLIHRVRKIRLMGSAGLALTYVADGRFDAYLEAGVRLWDIAAGGLIVECAGGQFGRELLEPDLRYALNVNNGTINDELARIVAAHAPQSSSH